MITFPFLKGSLARVINVRRSEKMKMGLDYKFDVEHWGMVVKDDNPV